MSSCQPVEVTWAEPSADDIDGGYSGWWLLALCRGCQHYLRVRVHVTVALDPDGAEAMEREVLEHLHQAG